MIKVKIRTLKDGDLFKRSRYSKVIYKLNRKDEDVTFTAEKSGLTYEVKKNIAVWIWKD